MFLCSTSSKKDIKMDALEFNVLNLLLPMLVLVLSIVHLDSVKKIIRCVFGKKLFIQITPLCLLMILENSQIKSLLMKEFMSKMLIKSFSKILKKEEEL